MSNAEATGGQSLEEILQSIRKSLAGDAPAGAAGAEPTAPAPPEARPQARPAPAEAAPAPKESPTDRLPGALDGKAAAAREDDIADMFETSPKPAEPSGDAARPAPAPAPAAAAPAAAKEGSDPLWFLSRRSADGGAKQPPAPEPAREPAAPARSEPLLSRPEILRSSLPPFFGASATAAQSEGASPERGKSVDLGGMRSRAQPATPHTAAEPAKPSAAAVAVQAPAAGHAAETKPAAIAATAQEHERGSRGAGPAAATAAAAAASPAPAAPLAAASAPTASAAKDAGPGTSPPAEPAPASTGAVPARTTTELVKAGDAKGTETRALETMVHEMLQPILREWCDKNLPRIVEATLKDELARAIKPPRDVDQT